MQMGEPAAAAPAALPRGNPRTSDSSGLGGSSSSGVDHDADSLNSALRSSFLDSPTPAPAPTGTPPLADSVMAEATAKPSPEAASLKRSMTMLSRGLDSSVQLGGVATPFTGGRPPAVPFKTWHGVLPAAHAQLDRRVRDCEMADLDGGLLGAGAAPRGVAGGLDLLSGNSDEVPGHQGLPLCLVRPLPCLALPASCIGY